MSAAVAAAGGEIVSRATGIVRVALEESPADPLGALSLAIWAQRMKLIACGEISPLPTERLPSEVARARGALAA